MRWMILAAGLLVLAPVAAEARDRSVRGYTTSRGTYVMPHHRTAPDRSRLDNYSTRGNVNPYSKMDSILA